MSDSHPSADLKGLASGSPEHVARWHQICDEADAAQGKWIADLRSIGVKAAHPDDGWVDRSAKEYHHRHVVQFQYPQFNDGVKAGDLIALGWPDEYRVRRVKEILPARWFGPERYTVTP